MENAVAEVGRSDKSILRLSKKSARVKVFSRSRNAKVSVDWTAIDIVPVEIVVVEVATLIDESERLQNWIVEHHVYESVRLVPFMVRVGVERADEPAGIVHDVTELKAVAPYPVGL